jgi:hypothetical protein
MSEPRPDEAGGMQARRTPIGARDVRLSTKLVALTELFVFTAEILVFVPSIAHFRVNRLQEMIQRADLVALSLANTKDVGRSLQDRSAWAPPLITFIIGTGSTWALGPPT